MTKGNDSSGNTMQWMHVNLRDSVQMMGSKIYVSRVLNLCKLLYNYWYKLIQFPLNSEQTIKIFGQMCLNCVRCFETSWSHEQTQTIISFWTRSFRIRGILRFLHRENIGSTTTELSHFGANKGVILGLKVGIEKYQNICSFMALGLFYGEKYRSNYSKAEVSILRFTKISHLKELSMLTQFQNLVQNKNVYWNENETGMIDGLVSVITNQQKMNTETEYETENEETETDFGKVLFYKFCSNANTTSTIIKD